jgi:hypothetical protein
MVKMIIEFEPNLELLTNPPKWKVTYYITDTNGNILMSPNTVYMSYSNLKKYIEEYGYETDNIAELYSFGINTSSMKETPNLIRNT